ncbi:DUF4200 domain-containing protein [Bradyrhizobium erythrophlei]|uniref:Uncharacterized protein n=1 Tax=Bradyrhizobium erythrophlei TaxID=1437360 RepID=A0A1M5R2S9_9BRAD|nr:DUF4200 domain-containing protein [Bradyrhizobium erythrophlei]SHH20642.1 hypothetical protein SAMN05444169_6312 [Bradyrhizobium erythrophlei]
MPAIADQVATLEDDHATAMASIDAQNATIEKLKLSLAAMTKEKLALEARVAEYQKHKDETIAAVEALASSTLDMLRTVQRPAGMPAAVVPFAPKGKTATGLPIVASAGFDDVLITEDMLKPEPPQPSVAAVGTHLGDEIDTRILATDRAPVVTAPRPGPTSAVDRIKRHFLPALTSTRRPGDSAMRVDPGELPMFLRRDTVFARTADAA